MAELTKKNEYDGHEDNQMSNRKNKMRRLTEYHCVYVINQLTTQSLSGSIFVCLKNSHGKAQTKKLIVIIIKDEYSRRGKDNN